MENNIFSFDRFLKVLKYDIGQRLSGLVTAFACCCLFVHVMHFMFDFGGDFSTESREVLFQAAWMLLSFYAPFAIYSAVGNKHGRASFIMLPASGLEKFASMLVVCVLLVPSAFFVCAYLLDSIIVVLFRDKYVDFLQIGQLDIPLIFKCIVCSVSAALCGRVFFRKGAVGKTILCIMAATFIWSLFATKFIMEGLTGAGDVDIEVMKVQYMNLQDILQYMYLIVSVVLYSLTYWRIKVFQVS